MPSIPSHAKIPEVSETLIKCILNMDGYIWIIVVVIVIILVVVASGYGYHAYTSNTDKEEYSKPLSYDKNESTTIINKLKMNLGRLDPKYTKVPIREGFKGANTKNKKTITICLRNPKTEEYYSENTLMYVLLHELAHVTSPTYGHDENFKVRMNELLHRAQTLGMYDPEIPIPSVYCGVKSY